MTPSEDDPPEPLAVLGAGVVVYGAMVIAALAWLLLRDRLEAVGEASIGTHGPFAASAVGLAVGASLTGESHRRKRKDKYKRRHAIQCTSTNTQSILTAHV